MPSVTTGAEEARLKSEPDETPVVLWATIGYVVHTPNGLMQLAFEQAEPPQNTLDKRINRLGILCYCSRDEAASVFKTRDAAQRAIDRSNDYYTSALGGTPIEGASVTRLVGSTPK